MRRFYAILALSTAVACETRPDAHVLVAQEEAAEAEAEARAEGRIDAARALEIRQQLLDEFGESALGVSVVFDDGAATLSGHVESHYANDLMHMTRMVSGLPGVDEVRPMVRTSTVAPAWTPDDLHGETK